ncbi:MAG: hypothetical protein ACRD5H_17075, partial [Nitrososphaerales archaeon]
MGFPEDYPNIDFFTNEFVDGVVGIKKALVDGRFEVSEVTTVIRALDSALADYMEKVLVGLKGL